jgi:PAS domain S-box-containing protein
MRKVIQHIESIFDVLSDGIYITDKSGKTLFVNKRYEQLTGLQMKDIKGLNVSTLLEEGVFDIILNPEIVRTRRPVSTAVEN